MLFTSSECILSKRLQHVLEIWNKIGRLSFIAVDEAHCIDMWEHGFRPDFLKLGNLKDYRVPIMVLTGTVTERAQSKIISSLDLHKPNTVKVKHARKNLFFKIIPKKAQPKKQVADFINDNCPAERGIVYCARRKDVVDLAHELKKENIDTVFVHGGMADMDRKQHEQAWACGNANVMCATKSFGMGIDKNDVRFVLHYCFPDSIEDYAQEIGRAGRDMVYQPTVFCCLHMLIGHFTCILLCR
jgi:bloom syndrome protein